MSNRSHLNKSKDDFMGGNICGEHWSKKKKKNCGEHKLNTRGRGKGKCNISLISTSLFLWTVKAYFVPLLTIIDKIINIVYQIRIVFLKINIAYRVS